MSITDQVFSLDRHVRDLAEKVGSDIGFTGDLGTPDKRSLVAAINSLLTLLNGGKLAFETYNKMVANKSSIPENSFIEVTNDTSDKNGSYLYNGVDFVKAQHDLASTLRSSLQNNFDTYEDMIADGADLNNGAYALVADDIDEKNGIYTKKEGYWVKPSFNLSQKLLNLSSYVGFLPVPNLFPNKDLSGSIRTSHTVIQEDGETVAVIESDTQAYSVFEYEVNNSVFKSNDEYYLSFDVFVDTIGDSNADITVRYYGENGYISQVVSEVTKANEYQKVEIRDKVPPDATKIWIRPTKRYDPMIAKFKNPVLLVSNSKHDFDLVGLKHGVDDVVASIPRVNLFPNPALTPSGSTRYEAVRYIENNEPMLELIPSQVSAVFYKVNLNTDYTPSGSKVDISVDIYCDVTGASSADLSFYIYDKDGNSLMYQANADARVKNEWHTVGFYDVVIPDGADHILMRFIGRSGNTVARFKNPRVMPHNKVSKVVYPNFIEKENIAKTVFVSKNGNDINDGSETAPKLTLNAAAKSLDSSGVIKVIGGGDFRESITIDKSGVVEILADYNNTVNIFGSDVLEFTVSEFTDVYQAPLAVEPTGMGGIKGQPMIAEWGTPSKQIPDDERHPLHHGKHYRLPYTPLYSAESKNEMTLTDNTWWWENGVIYLKVPAGTDISSKRYEARVRSGLTHTGGKLILNRVNSWFSNSYGMLFSGHSVERYNCKAFGAKLNGFADNGNVCISHHDEAGDCGNDGFNGSMPAASYDEPHDDGMCKITHFDPYGHDNGDDGFSCHQWVDATVYGGLFEHNTKADVIHVSGSNCICYGTEVRGTDLGFSSRGEPSAANGRAQTMLKCVGTTAHDNRVSYNGGTDGLIICENTNAINPSQVAYEDNIIARNVKYQISGDAVAKTSNVIVKNIETLN